MTNIVSLQDNIDAMDFGTDKFHSCLNKETGEEINAIQNKFDWNNFPDWQQEALASAKKVFDSSHFLPLPSKLDIHEYAVIEKFCTSTDDPKISNELSNLIKGSGAFGRFKNAIHRFGIEDDWYKYRDQVIPSWWRGDTILVALGAYSDPVVKLGAPLPSGAN
ncbi:MAG: hypothetical protein U5K99_07515 [Anaerolineales bacterium]|nr:hypothetical protein [Anaerolineales bacterium]